MARNPLDLWNHWSIQILVLVSLAIQVFLFVFSGTRRRGANPVLRILLWLAYMMADSTAIYALGHLSLIRSSKVVEQQQLVAFWASFLLLHLGGPDNMTAYALQDNQLWLRHLHILVVQVLGAAYVLYKLITANGTSFVVLAAILMFAIGVAKYGERTRALKRGSLDTIRSSIKKESHAKHHQFHALDQRFRDGAANNEELYVRRAHSLFHICKRAIVDSWIEKDSENNVAEMLMAVRNEDYKGMWILMEVELSLLYDILYTKAAVIHTWPGYCIRVISPLATVASFLLFHFSTGKDGHNRVDVGVTYTLLTGAFLLEVTSLLSALGSSWTYNFLCTTQWSWFRYTVLCTGRWDRIRRLVKMIIRRQGGGQARRWSGKMGQYNMLHLCSRRDTVLGTLAKLVGLEEWWNTNYYSGTIEITNQLRKDLFLYIKRLPRKNIMNTQGVIRSSWGEEPLKILELYDELKENYLGAEFQEGIIIWHIATDVFLAKSSRAKVDDSAELVKSVRTLSNYMMFLLVKCPDMLPGLAQTRLYQRTCQNLVEMWCQHEDTSHSDPNWDICSVLKDFFRLHDDPTTSRLNQREQLAITLNLKQPVYSVLVPRLVYANVVADKLLHKEKKRADVLELVLFVWMDFLVYTANRCSRESHAKRLSRGSELATVLWLMADYFHQDFLNGLVEP